MSALGHAELMALLAALTPRLDHMSPYELLQVQPPGNDSEIQRAFHQRAGKLHPDLYRTMPSMTQDDRDRVELVYARMTEAYMTLRDPAARAQWLQRHAPPPAPGRTATGSGTSSASASNAPLTAKAQGLYDKAQAALAAGDLASAVLGLRSAVVAQPGSALLRTALAEAQARFKK